MDRHPLFSRNDSVERRTFIGVLAAGTFASVAGVARAQLASARRIGVLTAGAVPRTTPAAFRDELRERGWVEGQNLVIERRGGDGNSDRVPALAAELAQMKLDVIVSFGAVAGVAIKNATTTIPIVATTGDPVRLGLVSNLSRPEGNITGVSLIAPELAAKRLELIHEFLPKATLIGELVDPANTYWQRVRLRLRAGVPHDADCSPLFVEVANPGEIEKSIAQIAGRTSRRIGGSRRSDVYLEPRTNWAPCDAVRAADNRRGPTVRRSRDADVLRAQPSSPGSHYRKLH